MTRTCAACCATSTGSAAARSRSGKASLALIGPYWH